MAEINFTPQFKRDYKKLKKKHYKMDKLKHVIDLLTEEKFDILIRDYDDHRLTGAYKNMHGLHVEHNKAGNWILVYEIINNQFKLMTINLVSTGNHDYAYRKR